jgi:cephalosporin hydroxylase
LASFMDALGHGTVITVDIDHSHVPDRVKAHPRIKLVTGDAVESVWKVASMIGSASVMVIEDSSHTFDNTLGVLRVYSPMVRKGFYFVVEDTVCHHGISVGPFPGPYEAVEAFLKEDPTWYSDRSREAFGITWNPKGFLKRKP